MRREADDMIDAAVAALILAAAETEALEHEDAERISKQLSFVRQAQALIPKTFPQGS